MPSVRYRYDTNQPWIVVPGDRWVITPGSIICSGSNIQPRIKVSAVIGGYSNGQLVLTPANNLITVNGDFGTTFSRLEIVPGGQYFTAFFGAVTNGTYVGSGYGGSGSSRYWHSVQYVSTEYWQFNFGTRTWSLINPATFQKHRSKLMYPSKL
ncbi:MAG: hypothetical protein HC930_01275 [Hydrococcus sp. SU_1_0]|nr:hypothetical protein [Hydrococcus sp. SU_1_0]